jgi:hypothetical protein
VSRLRLDPPNVTSCGWFLLAAFVSPTLKGVAHVIDYISATKTYVPLRQEDGTNFEGFTCGRLSSDTQIGGGYKLWQS